MNAMTATGIRERTHGMPDCCVVVGIGGTGDTTVCMVPGGDVVTSVGMVTKETMTHYIEECQDKHWDKTKEQKSLIEY